MRPIAFLRKLGSVSNMRPTLGLTSTYWVFSTYMLFVFVVGSGSRGDLESLILLRPVAVLVAAWAVFQFDRQALAQCRNPLLFMATLFLLPALHLIPLPSILWRALPGRELIVAISEATGTTDDARPLSLSPIDTVNALCSLFVPLAALLLAIRLNDRERRLMLPLMLAIGVLTASVGILQALTPGSTWLHFYRLDSMAAASGLFANRNHQAFYLACMLPMLAVFSATSSRKSLGQKAIIATGGVILLPLLLVTGSRAGLILGLVGLIALLTLLARAAESAKRQSWRHKLLGDPRLLIACAISLLAAVILLSRRAEAFKRLFASSIAEESRLQIWRPALKAAWELMPFGSGIGSFVRTYQVYETHDLLTPTYRNHAHNEFIEIAMTGGIPAILLLLIAIVTWGRYTWKWMRLKSRLPEILYGRLGSILLLLFAIASAVDYPIRVPSLACFLVVTVVWLRGAIGSVVPIEEIAPTSPAPKVSGFTARHS